MGVGPGGRSGNIRGCPSTIYRHTTRTTSTKTRTTTTTLALPETLFSIGTVAVLPLYGMMIGAPKATVSKRTMSSALPFALMGCLYGIAACLILQSAAARDLLSTFTSSTSSSTAAAAAAAGSSVGSFFASYAAHVLTFLSGCMSTAETAAAAWIHLLSLDLFVARHVFLDSVATSTPSRHSLVLCCMFGPVGYLSHTLTKALCRRNHVTEH